MLNSNNRLNKLLDVYLAADYRWERDGHWLPLAIGELAPEIDRTFPDATQFGLLSAWNPYSVPHEDHINRQADHVLYEALEGSGHLFRPAFASARNRSWKESSWLVVDMPLQAFDPLSRRFGQLGTLWWPRGQPIRLRMDAARPATANAHSFVDWIK